MYKKIITLQILTFVLAIAIGFGESSFANEGCSEFLKQSLAATVLGATGDGQSSSTNRLTAQSQQYLRLIEYALEKTTESSAKQSLLHSIKMATMVPRPINVFEHQIGVLGAKLQQAVDQMDVTQSLSSGWSRVQQGMKEILSKYAETDNVRQNDERDTNGIEVIDQAWKLLLNGSIQSSPSWQKIGDDWYLAVGSDDGKVYVLKFGLIAGNANEALTVVGEYSTGGRSRSNPSWQQIGRDWYLAVGSDDWRVYVLKFDSKASSAKEALTAEGEYITGGAVSSSLSWQKIEDDWYLAVGSADKNVYVLKFDLKAGSLKKALTEKGEYSTDQEVSSSPSWQKIGDDWYLAVGANDKKVYAFKFDSKARTAHEALTVKGEYSRVKSDYYRVYSSPSWQQIGSDWYLAVGSDTWKVYVLKFDSNTDSAKEALTLAGEYATGGNVQSSPSWQKIGDDWYLAVGSDDWMVYVFKFDLKAGNATKALTLQGEYSTDEAVSSSPSWQKIDGNWYLAAGSDDNKVYVLKFDSEAASVKESLTAIGEYSTGGKNRSSPSWQQIENDWYLAVGSWDMHLHLIKFGKRVQRPFK